MRDFRNDDAVPLEDDLAVDERDWDVLLHKGMAILESGDRAGGFNLICKAADNGHAYAQALAAVLYVSGEGGKADAVEAKHYARMAEEGAGGDEDILNMVNYVYGALYYGGDAVPCDIPRAYKYLKAITPQNEMSEKMLNALTSDYPLTAAGEIDLHQPGRSMLATFFLLAGLVITGFGAYVCYKQFGLELPTWLLGLDFIVCLGMLFWVPFSLLAHIALGIAAPLLGLVCMDDSIRGYNTGLEAAGLALPVGAALVALSYLQRKKGKAHPLFASLRMRDDGRSPFGRLFGPLVSWGEGEAYRDGSASTRSYKLFAYLSCALVAAVAAFAAWGVAHIELDGGVEWNVMNSPRLWFGLSVIGFFLQFGKRWMHFSYDEVLEVERSGGEKEYYKNDDVMQFMLGHVIVPFIMHLLVVPALYGAILYYIMMGGYAVLQGVFPYVLAILVIGSLWIVYRLLIVTRFRRFRYILGSFVAVMFIAIYYGIAVSCSSLPLFNVGEAPNVEEVTVAKVDESIFDVDITGKPIATDYTMYGLKGAVKSAVVNRYAIDQETKEEKELTNSYCFAFHKTGRILQDMFGNKYVYAKNGDIVAGNHSYTSVTRNKKGQIHEYADFNPDVEDDFDIQYFAFEYDQKGRLKGYSHHSWSSARSFNCKWSKDNQLASFDTTWEVEGDGIQYKIEETYNYLERDVQGNWTKRDVVKTYTQTGFQLIGDKYEDGVTSVVTEFIEYREIQYFD